MGRCRCPWAGELCVGSWLTTYLVRSARNSRSSGWELTNPNLRSWLSPGSELGGPWKWPQVGAASDRHSSQLPSKITCVHRSERCGVFGLLGHITTRTCTTDAAMTCERRRQGLPAPVTSSNFDQVGEGMASPLCSCFTLAKPKKKKSELFLSSRAPAFAGS